MRPIIALYIVSVAYSIIRYVAFAPQNIEHLPAFIVNKGVSMAAALCFMAGFIQQLRKIRGSEIRPDPAPWFRAGVFGAIIHIPISLAILRPGYFGEFFLETDSVTQPARLSFAGEMVFLFGGLTAALIYLLLRPSMTPRLRWGLSLAAMLTLLAHVLSMGYCRGLNINISHAYLPPMWLLSAVGVAVAVGALLMSRPEETKNEQRETKKGAA